MLTTSRAGGANGAEVSQGIYCLETTFFETAFVRCTLVVGNRCAALIDCGTVDTYSQVLGLMDQIGLAREDLRYLIVTHSHADHVGSMTALREECDSVVLAHRESVPFCKDFLLQFDSLFGAFPEEIPPTPELKRAISSLVGEPGPVDVHFDAGTTVVDLGGRELELIPTPGHAQGCLCVYDPAAKVLLTGDTVTWTGVFGEPPFYEDKSAYLASLRRVQSLDIEMLVPAHFAIRGRSEAEQFLAESTQQVQLVDALVLECVRMCEGSASLGSVGRCVCNRLGKDYSVPGLFTVRAHLRDLEQEGLIRTTGERGFWSPS